MNIPIGDDDRPLIIKVASIPTAKLQVYFIDNEDYFYENKEDGKVYNSKAEEVGVYKGNNVILNS